MKNYLDITERWKRAALNLIDVHLEMLEVVEHRKPLIGTTRIFNRQNMCHIRSCRGIGHTSLIKLFLNKYPDYKIKIFTSPLKKEGLDEFIPEVIIFTSIDKIENLDCDILIIDGFSDTDSSEKLRACYDQIFQYFTGKTIIHLGP